MVNTEEKPNNNNNNIRYNEYKKVISLAATLAGWCDGNSFQRQQQQSGATTAEQGEIKTEMRSKIDLTTDGSFKGVGSVF